MTDWETLCDTLADAYDDPDCRSYFKANLTTVQTTLSGGSVHPGGLYRKGIQVVFNIPARYAINFFLPQTQGPHCGQYLNRHAISPRVGVSLKGPTARDRIDAALAKIGQDGALTDTNGHYGAVELNGTGVRYFGDICLVLRGDKMADKTLTLLRNSYDMLVQPVVQRLANLSSDDQDDMAVTILKEWAGTWADDAVDITTFKMMKHAPETERRMTTGQISRGVLDDEDYVEVVRSETFEPGDLEEVRLTAEDAAAQAMIADQLRVGSAPFAAHTLWRHRRRQVIRLAEAQGVPTRVVVTSGRARS